MGSSNPRGMDGEKVFAFDLTSFRKKPPLRNGAEGNVESFLCMMKKGEKFLTSRPFFLNRMFLVSV